MLRKDLDCVRRIGTEAEKPRNASLIIMIVITCLQNYEAEDRNTRAYLTC